MSKLFDNVKKPVYSMKGADVQAVIAAEDKLGLRFSDEYRNYLMDYGVVSCGSHEFMGLGGDAYLDVVKETLDERKRNPRFPRNCYLIENLGIDGILLAQDSDGIVYEINVQGVKKVYGSLKEYVESISCAE